MEETLERLWNEFFAEECSVIDTREERELLKKSIEMHEAVNESLTKEKSEIVERYTELLYEIQSVFVKKAFFKGCDFAISFFLQTRKKRKKIKPLYQHESVIPSGTNFIRSRKL